MDKKKLIIIDGNSLANRAFYAIRTMLTTKDGDPTNAVYGFANMLVRLMDEEKPDMIAVAFDKSGPTFRHIEYEDYKATRKGMPDELRFQMPFIKELLSAFRIPSMEIDGYEADDIIGTVAKKSEEEGYECLIITGDKDTLQLVSDSTLAMLTKRGISNMEVYDVKSVEEHLGISPQYVTDMKGLAGDASDNIPGVPGIGPKTAIRLIKTLGFLEDILDNIDNIKSTRTKNLLRKYGDQARLSKRLATINREVPIEFKLDEFNVKEPDWFALAKLLERLEFKTLMKRIKERLCDEANPVKPGVLDLFSQDNKDNNLKKDSNSKAQGDSILNNEPDKYLTLKNLDEVQMLVDELMKVDKISFEIILENNNPMQSDLVGLAITHPLGRGFYIPFAHMQLGAPRVPKDLALKRLKPIFESEEILKICHDAKSKIICLRQQGITLKDPIFDTMIAAYLENPEQKMDITDIISQYLDDEVLGIASLISRSGKNGYPKTIKESEPDNVRNVICEVLTKFFKLKDILKKSILDLGMDKLLNEVEIPLIRVLADMEMSGVKVDKAQLRDLSADLGHRLTELEDDIFKLAGDRFNLNSPKQLSFILFEKLGLPPIKRTKTGYSTDAQVLTALSFSHDIAEKILDYRELTKLKGTYTDALIALINPKTDRIHTTFNQAVTSTGRLSSSDPNLQNIPIRRQEGRKIRSVFIPGNGDNLLLSADYSQIELRVLAHFSKDETMMESFRQGEDVHARTAAKVFGVLLEDVTPNMRTKAKAVNFGIIYGISDFGLARGIKITREEASEFIQSYFHHYEGVKKFLDSVVEEAKNNGYVTTLLNRRRYLPELRSGNVPLRRFAERTAMNTPIQGSAADIIKLAMVDVAKELKERRLNTKMILQVHDELVFDVPKKELDEIIDIVRDKMEGAVNLDVPLRVDIKIGPNWLELKELS